MLLDCDRIARIVTDSVYVINFITKCAGFACWGSLYLGQLVYKKNFLNTPPQETPRGNGEQHEHEH